MKNKDKNPSWVGLTIVFFLAWFFTYGNRVLVPPLLNLFQNTWDLSATNLGFLSSSLYLSYFLFQIPCGILADRWDKKKLLILGMFMQGTVVLFSAFCGSELAFNISRMITGIAQATLFTSCFSLISELMPAKSRALGIALAHAGMPIGSIYGLILVSHMTFTKGYYWGTAFVVSGIGTIMVGIIFLILFRNIKKSNQQEKNVPKGDKSSFISVFKNKNIILLSLIGFLEGYGVFMIYTWLPYYLNIKGFGAAQAASLSSVISFLAAPGAVIMALISDKIGKRKLIIAIFMPLTIVSLYLISSTSSTTVLIIALLLNGMVGRMTTAPLHISLVTESANSKNDSTSLAIFNTVASAAMFIAPTMTGWLLDITKTLEAGFYTSIILEVIAFLILIFMVKENSKSRKLNVD